MTPGFVHLRLHTEYSISDGLVRIEPLMAAAAARGMPAVAVTDEANLFAMVKFYRAAVSHGVKPIVGTDLYIDEGEGEPATRITLLCRNRAGYNRLTRLVTRAYTEGRRRDFPLVSRQWLTDAGEGLIVLSGGREGDVGRELLAGRHDRARQRAESWAELFPDAFYVELQRTGREGEEAYIRNAVELAAGAGIPVVASNDVRFLEREDFEAHEVRVCIHEGRTLADPRRPRPYTDQQYLRSPEEMAELFADLPEALENSVEIARRCNLELDLGASYLPEFPVPEGETAASHLRSEAERGLAERLARFASETAADPQARQRYEDRLSHELGVVETMGFPGYFLIVADFIRWARDNGVPVGPGRGSGAGSLVAYALGITNLDPLAYDLLFERFLNPERVSMPDFDIDFCMAGRDRVIDYVAERYGRDKVSQIITFGTMAARAVVRDVGRVLGYAFGYVDRVAKLIPFEIGMTLDRALQEDAEFHAQYQQDESMRALIDLARPLEGIARNAGKHAGGVVIAPSPLTDYAPLYLEPGGESPVTQFDKDDVEGVGLVKFDFLGLRTLTIIDWAVRTINAGRGADEPALDIDAVPLDDPATFALLKSQDTTAVFQLESRGMKDLIKRLEPDSFEDVIALVALFRPGPLQSGMVDDFINRKHGRERVVYPHPELQPILEPTYGVILYQEQVMQIAQVLAGYSLGAADLLRRAMGKKKPEEMAGQREIFMAGATERGVASETAAHIFDLMEKFAGYGFNKCLHGDTEIVDADTGEPYRVEELFRRRGELTGKIRVHSLSEDDKLERRTVEDIVWNGVKPVYRLLTRSGRELVATDNHPLRVFGGWKNLGDLRPGEAIATPRELPIDAPSRWHEHELITLAGLLSEGNTCHPSALYFYNNDAGALADFAAAAGGFENTKAEITWRSDGRGEVRATRAHKVPWNHPEFERFRFSGARQWADRLNILGRNATEKSVPPELFKLSDEDIALFLGRLWSGDGSLSLVHGPPYYATSSYQLARDVRHLLLRLGIHVTLHSKRFAYRGGTRDGYALVVAGEGMLERFRERIGAHVVGREQDLSSLDAHLGEYSRPSSSRDTIPADIRRWVDEERRAAGLTWKQLEARSGLCMREFYGSGSAGKKGFRRDTVSRLAEVLGSERLERQAGSQVFWDEVVAIRAIGRAETYDLTVEGRHNFVADGVIVHNSHSAAYALLSYQTAWLKAHHPAAFMAAVLSADMDNTDKVVALIDDCAALGLEVLPPDINGSEHAFTVAGPGVIRYGLGAIKGVGRSAIDAILGERAEAGSYADLYELCRRIDLRKANRRVLEALIRAGALDSLGANRATLTAQLAPALRTAEQQVTAETVGQDDLFGLTAEGPPQAEDEPETQPEWPERERLAAEKETLGLYLTGHPIEAYEPELRQFTSGRIADVVAGLGDPGGGNGGAQRREAVIAGWVVALRRQGGRRAFLTLDDRSARLEMPVFEEAYQRYKHLLVKDVLLVVKGTLSVDDFSGGFRVTPQSIMDIEQARESHGRWLQIDCSAEDAGALVERLGEMLEPFREGRCPVRVDYRNRSGRAQLALGEDWRIRPADELLGRLRSWLGRDRVRLVYRDNSASA